MRASIHPSIVDVHNNNKQAKFHLLLFIFISKLLFCFLINEVLWSRLSAVLSLSPSHPQG